MSTLRYPIVADDHLLGNARAAVQLVEYGDYQCPYCGEAHLVVKELARRYGQQIAVVFRNFPLTDAHPEALNAALVAEFAGTQGQFWAAHDALYENQDQLGPELYGQIVASLGTTADDFQQAIDSGALEQRIRHDIDTGLRSGVNGTPCFFINGQRADLSSFDSLLDIVGQRVART
ncbi:DsbA family protein [Ottowia pentelensis]|uniref:DsbA family protein n=1 Tax=Ottowia pentelensis TaxID=511108 RepID=A0ABV6PX91_9BURK|nr:thioredoxin domain-containing protein [Pseudomonadota bacterium]MBS0414613.1 thioredoxin domain-containing protein [Pseudomonadota bacterium]